MVLLHIKVIVVRKCIALKLQYQYNKYIIISKNNKIINKELLPLYNGNSEHQQFS